MFAYSYDYLGAVKSLETVTQLASEHSGVSSKLDQRYGDGAMLNGASIKRGHGWRSRAARKKHNGDNRDISTVWWAYAPIYKALQDTAPGDLQRKIEEHFGADVAPCNAQLKWLAGDLRRAEIGHAARSALASKNRKRKIPEPGF